MDRIALRLGLLLALLTFVGYAGLNTSLDPRNTRPAYAAFLQIVINGGSGLSFNAGADGCPDTLLPGESCTAAVDVQIFTDNSPTLSAPTLEVSGVLHTCTGDDPANPGTGGANVTAVVQNMNYTPGLTVFPNGSHANFDIVMSLDPAATNACQGKTATITVTLTATQPDDPTPTPSPTATTPAPVTTQEPPDEPQSVQQPPVNQVLGQQQQQQQPPLVNEVLGNQATPGLVTEVLALPRSGDGGSITGTARDVIQLALFATGAASLGLLLLTLSMRRRDRRED